MTSAWCWSASVRMQRRLRVPQLLHVITRKGKGYGQAEADQIGPV